MFFKKFSPNIFWGPGGRRKHSFLSLANKQSFSLDRQKRDKEGGAIHSRPCGAIGRRGIGPRAGAGSYVLYMLGSVRLGLICRRLKHRLEGIFMAPQGTVLNRSITIPHVKFLVRL